MSILGAAAIACVHLFVDKLRFLKHRGGIWLDASAGIAVGYVFVEISPHLASYQAKLTASTTDGLLGFLEHHTYLVALAGFVICLGFHLTNDPRRVRGAVAGLGFREVPVTVKASAVVVVLYSLLIGYMLGELPKQRVEPTILFVLVMALHLIGMDYHLRARFTRLYDESLKFAIAATLYVGWIVGVVTPVRDGTLALGFSFLAGGIVAFTVVEELPRDPSSQAIRSVLCGRVRAGRPDRAA